MVLNFNFDLHLFRSVEIVRDGANVLLQAIGCDAVHREDCPAEQTGDSRLAVILYREDVCR